MAIWSLTQERIEKLRKQIGDKEAEVDALQKLSPKDIWNVDLDAFVNEWNTQLDEESKRKKKIAGITRRASHKLGIGAGKGAKGKKKRKADDSDSDESVSDFGPVKKKVKPKKEGLLSYLQQDLEPVKKTTAAEALKSSSAFGSTAPQKQGTLLSHLVKKENLPQTDGASDEVSAAADPAPAPKRGRQPGTKVSKKPTPIDSDDEDEDVFAAVAKEVAKKPAGTITTSRTARGATKQAPKYNIAGSDSDSEGDDLLGDVSSMVKTIGASNGVPMFKSTASARPVSNGSARPGSAAGGPKASKKNAPIEIDDDTNYEGLMPQSSPQRPAPRNVNDTIMSSGDDFSLAIIKKPVTGKLATKPNPAAAKLVPKPKTATSSLVAKKPTALSPAAKAYAAKHAKSTGALAKSAPKAKKPITIESDEDEEMEDVDALANDILSDEDDEDEPVPKGRAPAARPGRRAAAKPAKYVVSDDEAESDEASEASFNEDSE
jgi:DNA topoisomerase-2